MLDRPSNGFWAGLIAGILAVTALMASDTRFGYRHDDVTAFTPTSEKSAEAFVRDWERMRNGTWVIDGTFTRTLPGGRTFSASTREVQRPPDRLRVSVGTTTFERNGEGFVCAQATEAGSKASCRSTGPVDFARSTQLEVDQIRESVLGDERLYDVGSNGPNCYRLLQRPTRVSAAWGEDATFCFEPKTGAMVKSEFHRGDAVDTTVSVVRATVTDPDLQPPAS